MSDPNATKSEGRMQDPREVLERMAKVVVGGDDPHPDDVMGYCDTIQAALRELFVAVDDVRGYPTKEAYLLAVAKMADQITELEL